MGIPSCRFFPWHSVWLVGGSSGRDSLRGVGKWNNIKDTLGVYLSVLKQETEIGTESQESFWEHEEEHNTQVEGYRACDSSAVGVILGDYATRFPETGHIESGAPPHPFLPPLTGLDNSHFERATIQLFWSLQPRLRCLASLQQWVKCGEGSFWGDPHFVINLPN